MEQPLGKSSIPVTIIGPSSRWTPVNLSELWAYRELLYILTWREIKVRYKQTLLGATWAVIRPISMMVVFTIFFGNLAKIPSEGIPYALFNFTALLPWTLFADGITRASESLISNSALVQKVYCPRLIIPMSGILSPLVDFALAFVILIGMMFYFGYPPTFRILLIPVLVALVLMASLGVGFWLSALNAQFRDVRYAVPFLIQIWLFASPVVYASTLLPERFQLLYGLNPMSGIIESFRWALLGTEPPNSLMAISLVMIFLMLISGAFYFRQREKIFADVI